MNSCPHSAKSFNLDLKSMWYMWSVRPVFRTTVRTIHPSIVARTLSPIKNAWLVWYAEQRKANMHNKQKCPFPQKSVNIILFRVSNFISPCRLQLNRIFSAFSHEKPRSCSTLFIKGQLVSHQKCRKHFALSHSYFSCTKPTRPTS